MKMKKLIATAASLVMVFGAAGSYFPQGTFFDTAISASAEEGNVTLDESTGVLTLRGNITKEQVWAFRESEKVTSIVAAEGCVFPEDCSYMFGNNGSTVYFPNIVSIDISKADTSNVKDMSYMFALYVKAGYKDLKSINVSGIDTSNVTDMSNMFAQIGDIENLDLSSFDTSKVTNMSKMFESCRGLYSLDVSNFDTSNVTNMRAMFGNCHNLKYLDVSNFDTSKVTDMTLMFAYDAKLTELDLSSFDTSAVINEGIIVCGLYGMFSRDEALRTIYVSDKWSVVGNGEGNDMFGGAQKKDGSWKPMALVGGNGTVWNSDHRDGEYARIDREGQPGYFTDIAQKGDGSVKLDMATGVLTLSGHITKEQVKAYSSEKYVTSIVAAPGCVFPEDCSNMFGNKDNDGYYYFENIRSIDISKADTSNVRNMRGMFNFNQDNPEIYKELTEINVSDIDTSNVMDMSYMFSGCTHVKSIDAADFDTSKVTDMSCMFYGCRDAETIDVRNFDTSSVTNMKGMFAGCNNLKSIDITTFDTSKVTNMSNMFRQNESLETLDLTSFSLSALEGYESAGDNSGTAYMFCDCISLKTIYVSGRWNIPANVAANYMFLCFDADSLPIKGGNGTKWSKSHSDGDYARIDKAGQPGYFTSKNFVAKPKLGNTNRDSGIDIEDAVMVINQVNGASPLRKYSSHYADVDGSGTIDIEDAVAIISHVNGIKAIE